MIGHKVCLVILLVFIPLLGIAPVADRVLDYLHSAQGLREIMFGESASYTSQTAYLIRESVSVVKSNFADKSLQLLIKYSIARNYSPTLAVFDPVGYLLETSGFPKIGNATRVCKGQDSIDCITYSYQFETEGGWVAGGEWAEFSSAYSPFDTYATKPYCISFDRMFAVDKLSLTYSLPSGYKAGFENYTEQVRPVSAGSSSLNSSSFSKVSCFQIGIVRDTLPFLALAMYTTLPLLLLYFIGVLTLTSVPDLKTRLQVYVGALFSTFAYFFSLRQVLQSVLSWSEVAAMFWMTLWIMIEVVAVLMDHRFRC